MRQKKKKIPRKLYLDSFHSPCMFRQLNHGNNHVDDIVVITVTAHLSGVCLTQISESCSKEK